MVHLAQPGDMAADCVALAALFKKYGPTIKAKHAVSKAQVEEAASVGSSLQLLLKPSRARAPQSPADVKQATDDRDRLRTLLVQGHDAMWRAGAYLFGQSGVDAKVPPLLAHHGGHPKKTKAPTGPKSPGKSSGDAST